MADVAKQRAHSDSLAIVLSNGQEHFVRLAWIMTHPQPDARFADGSSAVTLSLDDYKPVAVVSHHWTNDETPRLLDEECLWQRQYGKIIARYTPWELDLCMRLVAERAK